MKSKTFYLILATLCLISSFSFSQNVGINATGTAPDASAMLDVAATDKGLLVPRVTLTGTTDATTISSPATSLLVYNTTAAGSGTSAVTPGYYYNSGTTATPVWTPFSSTSKFQITVGTWFRTLIAGRFHAIGGPLSTQSDAVQGQPNYGNGGTPVNSGGAQAIADPCFVATSAVKFNGSRFWFNSASGGTNISFSLYKKTQTNNTGIVAGFTQIGSTVTTTFTAGSNVYSVVIPSTSDILQPGEMLYLFAKVNTTNAMLSLVGSIEFINQ